MEYYGPCAACVGGGWQKGFAMVSPEGKQHGKRYRSGGFVGQIRRFRPAEKKYKIKGGGRKAPTSRSHRPATRAVPKDCGISPLPRPGWSVSGIFKIKVVGRAKNSAFPSGCAVSGWRQYFFPLKVQTLRRHIKEKGRKKSPPKEFLTN